MNKQAVKKLKDIFEEKFDKTFKGKMNDGNGRIRHWKRMKRAYGGGGKVGLDNVQEYIELVKK